MHRGTVSYRAKTPRPGFFYQKAPWCQPGKPATKPTAPREETFSSELTSPNAHLPKLSGLQPLCPDPALTALPFTQIWAFWQEKLSLWGRREHASRNSIIPSLWGRREPEVGQLPSSRNRSLLSFTIYLEL